MDLKLFLYVGSFLCLMGSLFMTPLLALPASPDYSPTADTVQPSSSTTPPPFSISTSTLPAISATDQPPASTPPPSSYSIQPPASTPAESISPPNGSTAPPTVSISTASTLPVISATAQPLASTAESTPPSSYATSKPVSISPESTRPLGKYTTLLPASILAAAVSPTSSYTAPPPDLIPTSTLPYSTYTAAPLTASPPASSNYSTPLPVSMPTAYTGSSGNPVFQDYLPSTTTSCSLKLGNNTLQFGDGIKLQLIPGECSLVLAKLCNNSITQAFFSVNIRNQGNEPATSIVVEIYEQLFFVQMNGGENSVQVNGLVMDLPAYLIPQSLNLSSNGSLMVLKADFGVVIQWDQDGLLEILLPIGYQDNLCGGLCLHQNATSKDVEMSYELPQVPSQCYVAAAGNVVCSMDKSRRFNICRIFLGGDSPFQKCLNVVNPDDYFASCQSHLCGSSEDAGLTCRDLQDYAAVCQSLGIAIKPWRDAAFCPFPCPQGGEYRLCIDPCSDCRKLDCSGNCTEGCRCMDGFMWDGIDCVPTNMCMAYGNSSQMQMNTTVPIQTKYLSCDPNTESQRKCLLCTVNDSNITTFGDFSSGLAGNGAYDLLRKCDPSQTQWLRIVLLLNPPVPGRLHIFFEQSFITINSVLDVWVNGNMMDLPITLASDLFISRWMDVVSIGQPGKMDLTFNSSGEFTIEVAESFSMEYCGACAFRNISAYSMYYWRAEDLSYW
ncbi:zonadhesin-like isoform X1 [Pseudophryne corroboree]|uniref:zonadhesin-like isoform X1 n=1 Tax=Pseudophryne corroboree TaxID=495146 RepID=UPI0030819646